MKFTIWFLNFRIIFFGKYFLEIFSRSFRSKSPIFLFGDQKEFQLLFFFFSGQTLVERFEETAGGNEKVLLYIGSKHQCHETKPLSTSGRDTSGCQKTLQVFHKRSYNIAIFNDNFMKLCTQIVDTQAYMLHYKRKLPAPTMFELLSFKLYKKGGCFSKIHKINEKFFLFNLH